MAFAQRFYTSLVFISLALLVVVSFADEVNKTPDDDKTIRSDDVSARVQRVSGRILIVRDNDGSNDDDDDSGDGIDDDDDSSGDDADGVDDDDFRDDNEDLLSFELDDIEEKDADGNDVGRLQGHSVDSFDNVNFDLSQVSRRSTFQGISATNVNLSAYLDDPKANLEVMLYLFREAGTVSFGTETFAVQDGTVKFNIKISNWDFCDASQSDCSEGKQGEYLDLKLKIKSKGSPSEVSDDDRKQANKQAVCQDNDASDNDGNDPNDYDDDDDCPIIYDMGGDSEMLLNRGVMIDDNKYTAMPAGYPKIEIEDGERKFKFRIPRFDQNVVVDPSVTPGKVSSSQAQAAHASWMQINVAVLLLQLVAAFLAH